MLNSPRSRRRATPQSTGAPDLFEGRFSEILIIFVLALIVLGPEKLPRVVSELGRWAGRARAMARQFREQLEEEVQLEEARKAQRAAAPAPADPPPPHAPPAASAPADPPAPVESAATATAAELPRVVPAFSNAPPTDATGADTSAARAGQGASADERGT